jgi:hypothetical protein
MPYELTPTGFHHSNYSNDRRGIMISFVGLAFMAVISVFMIIAAVLRM